MHEASWHRHISFLCHFALLCCLVWFLAAMGLPGVPGLSLVRVCGLLNVVASLLQALKSWHTALVAPRHVESS